jgi:hypothetical protein
VSSVPYIHDITTDVGNPPEFVAARALRKEGDHPVAYDGPEVGAQQKEAYPDLAPLITKAPKEQVFDVAKSTLASMGLEITDANPADGRLEGVDTTLLYGFKDDMVVRIQGPAGYSGRPFEIAGRAQRSGVNAKRIRPSDQAAQRVAHGVGGTACADGRLRRRFAESRRLPLSGCISAHNAGRDPSSARPSRPLRTGPTRRSRCGRRW